MSPSQIPGDALARLVARDGALYSDDLVVAAEAAAFMGWTDLAARAESVLPVAERLAHETRAEGVTDVVLLGMGGSSLAALVMASLLPGDGTRLHVLDTTSPVTVAATLGRVDPARAVFVVSSKSGGTIEPNTLYAVFRAHADRALGRDAAGARFIAITDPGSSLERLAQADGMRACVLTPPDVGGRYSALTAFGLVPAALVGIDVRRMVAAALEIEGRHHDGTADLALANLIADAHARGADKLTIVAQPELRAFGLWVEQLVAESLGKNGTGVVPVVAQGEPRVPRDDEVIVELNATGSPTLMPADLAASLRLTLDEPHELGGWFVLWEYAVALVGAALRVNPFDQPNVAEAKDATAAVLAQSGVPEAADVAIDGVEITFAGSMLAPQHVERSLATVLEHALDSLDGRDYLAVLAYVPDDSAILGTLAQAAHDVSHTTATPVCLELGPRYLHSTGQLHKGGPNAGVFIVLTTRDETDVTVPNEAWTLRDLHRAQAEGDVMTLARHGRRVLHVSIEDASHEQVHAFADALTRAASAHRTSRTR